MGMSSLNRKILHGDVLEKLKEIPDGTIDFVCTDPPYGYSFMNKDWDKAIIGVDTWRECLRVLKPGAFACVMSAPRQDVMSRIIINLENAGFAVGFTSIYWVYASGFPKAGNISKMVDNKLGLKREIIGVNEEFKKKNKKNIESGQSNFNKNSQFKGTTSTEAGFQHPETIGDITKPTSTLAKKLDGSYAGFQPKPATEVILVVMKPLSEKTYVDQAMNNKKGISWFDDCRIPSTDKEGGSGHINFAQQHSERNNEHGERSLNREPQKTEGRFPANLLVSDDVLNDGKDRKGVSGGGPKEYGGGGGWDDKINRQVVKTFYSDSGSFSRYFDLDAWQSQFLIVEKSSSSEKNLGLKPNKTSLAELCHFEDAKGIFTNKINMQGRKTLNDTSAHRGKAFRLNDHPTVKPISLMSYLITMFSRKDDIILDTFAGSGTTLIAASLLQRNFIGIEKDHHNCIISNLRLNYWKNRTFDKVGKIIKEQEKRQQVNLEEFCLKSPTRFKKKLSQNYKGKVKNNGSKIIR